MGNPPVNAVMKVMLLCLLLLAQFQRVPAACNYTDSYCTADLLRDVISAFSASNITIKDVSATNGALATAVANFGSRCRGIAQDVLRAVRLMTPNLNDEVQQQLAQEFTRRRGYRIEYDTHPIARIAEEVQFQLETNVSLYDAWVLDVPSSEAVLRANGAAVLGDLDTEVQEQLSDSDVLPLMQDYGAMYGGRRTAVVVSGQVPLLYWRRDLFAAANLTQPPATWDELLAVAQRLNGTDFNGDGQPDSALCWQTEGCIDSSTVLSNVLASMTQYLGRSSGWLFKPDDMAPLAAGPPLQRALELFRRLTRLESRGSSGCRYLHTDFLNGTCAMTIKWAQQFKVAELSHPELHGLVGVAPLPGSTEVWNRETNSWISCGSDPAASPCPHATLESPLVLPTATTAATAAGRTLSLAAPPPAAGVSAPSPAADSNSSRAAPSRVWVNRAPYCGMLALLGSVAARTSADYGAAALSFFALVTSPNASWDQMSINASAVGPFRKQHLDPANVPRWLDLGYNRYDLLPFLESWRQAVEHPNAALPLRLPGAGIFRDTFFGAAQKALGKGTVESIMADVQAQLKNGLASSGVPPMEVQRSYWRTLGYEGQEPPPLPPAARQPWLANRANRIGVAVAATATGLGVIGLVAYLWHRSRRRLLRRTLFGRARAPEASPATSLVVTDIVDSTRLWETVPQAAMARAVQLHHDTLRSLLQLHNGYESATEGDSFILSFYSATDAVTFALRAQAALLYQPWPEELTCQDLCRPQYAVCRTTGGGNERARSGMPRASLLPRTTHHNIQSQSHGSLASDLFVTSQPQVHQQQQHMLVQGFSSVRGMGVSDRAARAAKGADDSQHSGSAMGLMLSHPASPAMQLATPQLTGGRMLAPTGSQPQQQQQRRRRAPQSLGSGTSGALTLTQSLPVRRAPRQSPSTPQLLLGPTPPSTSTSTTTTTTTQLLAFRPSSLSYMSQQSQQRKRLAPRTRTTSASVVPYVGSAHAEVLRGASCVSLLRGGVRGGGGDGGGDGGDVFSGAGPSSGDSNAMMAAEYTLAESSIVTCGIDQLRHLLGSREAGEEGEGRRLRMDSGPAPMSVLYEAEADSATGGGGGEDDAAASSTRRAPSSDPWVYSPGCATATTTTIAATTATGAYLTGASISPAASLTAPSQVQPDRFTATAVSATETEATPHSSAVAVAVAVFAAGGSAGGDDRDATFSGMWTGLLAPAKPAKPPAAAPPAGALGATAATMGGAAQLPEARVSEFGPRGLSAPSVDLGPDSAVVEYRPQQSPFANSGPPVVSGAGVIASGHLSTSLCLLPYRRTSVQQNSALMAALVNGGGQPSGVDVASSTSGGSGFVRSLTLRLYYQQLFRSCQSVEPGAVRISGGLQVRMGVHSGVTSTQVSYNRVAGRTQYSGAALEGAKAIGDAAQGGMVLLSSSAFNQLTRPGAASSSREPSHVLLDMGHHAVKMGPEPVPVYMAQSRELLPRLAFLGPVRSSEQTEPGVMDAPLGDVSMASLLVVGLQTLLAWDKDATEVALATFRHLAVTVAMRQLGGHVVEEGQGKVLAVFGHPYDAIRWAASCEALLKEADWSESLLGHELAEEVQGPVLLNSRLDAPVVMGDVDLSRLLFRGLRIKGAVDCAHTKAELLPSTGRLVYRGNLGPNVQRIANYVSTGQVVCSRRAWRGYEAAVELAAEVTGEAVVVGASLGQHSIRGMGDKVELWSIRLEDGGYGGMYDGEDEHSFFFQGAQQQLLEQSPASAPPMVMHGHIGNRLGQSLAEIMQAHSRAYEVTGDELRGMLSE